MCLIELAVVGVEARVAVLFRTTAVMFAMQIEGKFQE